MRRRAVSHNTCSVSLYMRHEIGINPYTRPQAADSVLALRHAFPKLKGFSPRNPHYVRTCAGAYPDATIAQQPAARLSRGYLMRLLDTVPDLDTRTRYAQDAG